MMRSVLRRFLPALTVVLLPALIAAAPAAASPGRAGHVYVNDNTAGTNTISAYTRHADGTLTTLPGSPFSAGGAGTGAGLASQGALQVSTNGRYLIAVDAGSNQISILRIGRNGDPALVPGGVVSSNGFLPVSVTEHNGLVYVANAGPGEENYTGFTLNPGGRLRPLPGSTFTLPDTAQPGDVLFNSTGTNLVGTRVSSSQIDSFSVGADGRLTRAPDSPFPAQGVGPFGSEFRPTNPAQLFVSNAHNGSAPDGTGLGTVSAFSVAGDGNLSSIGASPFADRQIAPCWVEITHDGQFLFTVNTASGSISRYSIASDGSLGLIGSTPVTGGGGAVDARLSPGGQDLYVNESKSGALGEFSVSGGDLTELGSVAVPSGPGAAGVATN